MSIMKGEIIASIRMLEEPQKRAYLHQWLAACDNMVGVFYRIRYDIQSALPRDMGCGLDTGYFRTRGKQHKAYVPNVFVPVTLTLAGIM